MLGKTAGACGRPLDHLVEERLGERQQVADLAAGDHRVGVEQAVAVAMRPTSVGS